MASMKAPSRRRGITVVELALVLPLLLLIVLGGIEYGWLFLKAEEVTNAARHGARVAVRAGVTDDDEITGGGSVAADLLAEAGIPVRAGTITVPTGVNPGTGKPVTVVVTVPYDDVRLFGLPFVPVPPRLHASVTMAKEGF